MSEARLMARVSVLDVLLPKGASDLVKIKTRLPSCGRKLLLRMEESVNHNASLKRLNVNNIPAIMVDMATDQGCAKFMGPAMQGMVNAMVQIAGATQLDTETRIVALEIICTLGENRPGLIRKMSQQALMISTSCCCYCHIIKCSIL